MDILKGMSKVKRLIMLAGCIAAVSLGAWSAAASERDGFVHGYASAILEREFGMSGILLRVEDGIIYLPDLPPGADRTVIIDELSRIEGVRGIDAGGRRLTAGGQPEGMDSFEGIRSSDEGLIAGDGPAGRGERLFEPLIADPRWPTFSGAYQYYFDDGELESIFAASVGDVLPVYTANVPFSFGGRWQVGGEGGAFVVHDLDSSSWDQVNADYLFGLTLSYRKDNVSGIFRVFHQSSHVGDEYLLHNDVDRENYSYEAVGLLLSNDLSDWLRVYGGGEFHFSVSPKELDPWVAHYGIELSSPRAYLNGLLRPIAAADLKHREDNDWSGEISLIAGLRVEGEQLRHHNLRLTLGYFNGHSPNGQFYKNSVEYLSTAFHFNF